SSVPLALRSQSNMIDTNPEAHVSSHIPLFLPESPISDTFTDRPHSPDPERSKNDQCASTSADQNSLCLSLDMPQATPSPSIASSNHLESFEPLSLDFDDDFIAFATAPQSSTAIIAEQSDSSANPQYKSSSVAPTSIKTDQPELDRKAIKEGKKRARSPQGEGQEQEHTSNLPKKKVQTADLKIHSFAKNGADARVKIPDDYLDHKPSEDLEIAMVGASYPVNKTYIDRIRAAFMEFIQQMTDTFEEFSPCPQQESNSRKLFHRVIRESYQNLVNPIQITPSTALPPPELNLSSRRPGSLPQI
ncbi:hypothetical protein DFH28DRAFT_894759, partial [Melampsora americana]